MTRTKLTQGLLNDVVGSNWDSLVVNLGKTSLVNKFPDALKVRISPCNVGFTNTKHVNSSLVQLDKYTIVNLLQAE